MNTKLPPAIQLSALSRQFGSLKAVDNLSLEIQPGSLFGFLGPNGAGKKFHRVERYQSLRRPELNLQ